MREQIKPCDSACPSYVKTIQYVIEPHWEQVMLPKVGHLVDKLAALKGKPIPDRSSLADCLQCNFGHCFLIEQPPPQCCDDKIEDDRSPSEGSDDKSEDE